MAKLLIKVFCDYADEFDLNGFFVISKSEWRNIKRAARYYFQDNGTLEVNFGTNQELFFDSFSDWLKVFKVKEITPAEEKQIRKLFGSVYFGYEGPIRFKEY